MRSSRRSLDKCVQQKSFLRLAETLRHYQYWLEPRPEGWLFSPLIAASSDCRSVGKPKINPQSPRQLNRAFTSAKHMAGIKKAATLHMLSHSFTTHRMEANTPSRQIAAQSLAGRWMSGSSPGSRYAVSMRVNILSPTCVRSGPFQSFYTASARKRATPRETVLIYN